MSGFRHALIVGGSGMLAGLARTLLRSVSTVSVLARDEARIRAIAPGIHALSCDYNDEAALVAALAADRETCGAPDLLVAWIHGRAPSLRRRPAEQVARGGRFVQVLGSAHGDPAHPERLEEMAQTASGLPLHYQAVVLGFVVKGHAARWNSNAEISQGVGAIIESGAAKGVVGTLSPWALRPAGGAPFTP